MTWTRKELKDRGKEALKRNYWKAVVVALLIAVLGGGGITPATAAGGSGNSDNHSEGISYRSEPEDFSTEREELSDGQASVAADISSAVDSIGTELNEAFENIILANPTIIISLVIVVMVIVLLIFVIAAVFDIFLINPLMVGAQRFMLKSVDGTGNLGELGYLFDNSYINGVKAGFHRDLQIFLWALLFIIPGIYKKYQYYMVDYILAETPQMPWQEVLNRSKEMMEGQKWNTFVLDLSFIVWHMLSLLTCGLLEIFYVSPYQYMTRASLYRRLLSSENTELQDIKA